MTRTSGRELIFDSIVNAVKGLQKAFQAVKGGWEKIFPPTTSEQLYGIIDAVNQFSQKLIMSEETADKVSRAFSGLFAVLDIAKQAFSAVFDAVKPLFDGFGNLASGILDGAASLGDWLVGLDEAIKESDFFGSVVQKISGFVGQVSSKVKEFLSSLGIKIDFSGFDSLSGIIERIKSGFSELVNFVRNIGSKIGDALDSVGSSASGSGVVSALQSVLNMVKSIGAAIITGVKEIASGIAEAFDGVDFSGVLDLLNGVSFAVIADGISKFINKKKSDGGIAGLFHGIKESITDTLGSVKGSLEAWQKDIDAGVILKIASAIGILSGSLVLLASVDADDLHNALGAVTVTLGELIGALAIVSKLSFDKSISRGGKAMVEMASSLLILAGAVKMLSGLDSDQLINGVAGIAGLCSVKLGRVPRQVIRYLFRRPRA